MTPQEAKQNVPTIAQTRQVIRKLIAEDNSDVNQMHDKLQSSVNALMWFISQLWNEHGELDDNQHKVLSMADLQKTPSGHDLKLYGIQYRTTLDSVMNTLNNQQPKNMLANSKQTAGISLQELINSMLVAEFVNAGALTSHNLEKQLDNEFDRSIKRAEPLARSAKKLDATSPVANILKKFRNNSDDVLSTVKYGDNRKSLKKKQHAFTDPDMLGHDWHNSLWDNVTGLVAGYNQAINHQITKIGGIDDSLFKQTNLNDLDDFDTAYHKYISNLDRLIPSQKQIVNNKATFAIGITAGVKYWSLVTMQDSHVCKYCDGAAMDNPWTMNQIIRNNWYPLLHLHCRCQWVMETDTPIYIATGLPKKK